MKINSERSEAERGREDSDYKTSIRLQEQPQTTKARPRREACFENNSERSEAVKNQTTRTASDYKSSPRPTRPDPSKKHVFENNSERSEGERGREESDHKTSIRLQEQPQTTKARPTSGGVSSNLLREVPTQQQQQYKHLFRRARYTRDAAAAKVSAGQIYLGCRSSS